MDEMKDRYPGLHLFDVHPHREGCRDVAEAFHDLAWQMADQFEADRPLWEDADQTPLWRWKTEKMKSRQAAALAELAMAREAAMGAMVVAYQIAGDMK